MSNYHSDLANTSSVRELHTPGYVVADAAARAALTGMQEGDLCFQSDTDTFYQYDGSVWETLGAAGLTNPMAALGDLIYGDTGGTPAQLAGNTTTTKKFLTQTGDGVDSAAPAWGTIAAADVPAHKASHQNGGGDEISVAGLSGELADPQPPKDHNHTAAGGDGGVLTNDAHDGYSDYSEIAAPTAPGANVARLYAKDDGGGNTKLYYKDSADTEYELPTLGTGGTGAPSNAKYWTSQAESGLSAEENIGGLSTGILKVTVAAGVATPSIAVAGDLPSVKLDDAGAPDDNTDLNVSNTAHGLMPKVTTAGYLAAVRSNTIAYEAQYATINFVIDGGGSAITTGIKGDLVIDFGCTVLSWTLLADQSGSIVIDVWKDTYANFPPTDADAMPGSGKEPTLSSAAANQDTDVTDWSAVAIAAGAVLRFNVDSATTVTRVTLALKVVRT